MASKKRYSNNNKFDHIINFDLEKITECIELYIKGFLYKNMNFIFR